ncbi:MAG: DUF1549 domain-containing protein [Planctomycetaceae bacterium]
MSSAPPTAEQLVAFQQDYHADAEAAITSTVDRLMSSPEFGEHWGRHWLDVARYADSNGGDFNATFHDAWRYRDYVIAAFNSDKPFDQFIREQLAGDMLPADSDAQRTEQLVATGFLMLGPKMLSERDKEKLRMDVIDEQINTLGQSLLGLTLGCARCHDHKFDPIPTRDYYALAGIFGSSAVLDGEIQKYVSNWGRQPLPIDPQHAADLAAHKERVDDHKRQLAAAKKLLERAEKELSAPTMLGIVVDDADAEKVGDWKPSTHVDRFVGVGYVHDDKQGKGDKSITYRPQLPRAGEYEVRFSFASSSGRDSKVPVHVHHAAGETLVHVDQQPLPPINDLFVSLGRFAFEAGAAGFVTVSTEGTTEYVIADAMQFIPVEQLAAGGERVADADSQAKVDELKARRQELEEGGKQLEKDAPPPPPGIGDPRGEGHRPPVFSLHSWRARPSRRSTLPARLPARWQCSTSPPTIPADASGRLELCRMGRQPTASTDRRVSTSTRCGPTSWGMASRPYRRQLRRPRRPTVHQGHRLAGCEIHRDWLVDQAARP